MTFFSLINPYKKTAALVLFCTLCANLLSLAIPWAIKILIDDVLVNRNFYLLNVIMMALLGVVILRSLFAFLRKYISATLGERVVCDVRQKIYWHVERLSITSINRITVAQILSRFTGDVENIRQFLFRGVIEAIYAVLNCILIVSILFFINIKMTFAAVAFLPLFAIIYFRLIPELQKHHGKLRESYSDLIARVSEVLHGIRTVRAFAGNDYEKKGFMERHGRILKTASRTHRLNSWLWIGMELFTSLGIVSMLWIGGSTVIAGKMTAGELVAFYSYLGMLFSPVIQLVVINSMYQEARASLHHINKVIVVDDEVRQAVSGVILRNIKGEVRFKNVSFGYSTDGLVLNGITFSAGQGETVGIVGASGAGKTTLVSLLLRFFDPREGEIILDGHPLKDLDINVYRRQIAVVLQDDFLFSGSIAENIRYGTFDAPQDKIIEAAQSAQIHSFISGLPRQYETRLGERGFNLSSGQRQRIAIARALVKYPSILILDEATSAVDAFTENAIQKSLQRNFPDITVFIVAHRFSTIMETDKIIVLEQGKIVETGGHNYLLKKGGFYSNLYFEQFKKNRHDLLVEI